MSEVKTRQPMCPGGKIQLPKINRDLSMENGKIVSSTITMNGSINSNDLCYNRCPNGEAPQADKISGNYFCLVPSLVTYQIKQYPKEPTVTKNSDGTETTIHIGDQIDYTKSYTVSCQSTDIMDFSTPQTGNENNTMFGTPIQIISGLYEDPLGPNDLRSSDYRAKGDYKWFCKRPMYGAPPLGALQSAYEAINPDIIKASEDIPEECQSAVEMASKSGSEILGVGSAGATTSSGSKNNASCALKNVNQKAAIGISNGVQIVQDQKYTISPANPLTIINTNGGDGTPVPNTITTTDANTGAISVGLAGVSAMSMGGASAGFGVSLAAGASSNGGGAGFGVSVAARPPYCNTSSGANRPECQ
jgi:hypothetical protein